MNSISRMICASALVAGSMVGLSGAAFADTARGTSCGEPHVMAQNYYDGFGNAAPCTADFAASRPGTATITIQVVPRPGNTRQDPHMWSFDISDCRGTILPGAAPATFTCSFDPGAHTVYVDKSLGDSYVDLTVDYS
jgi:hypothetical protein